MSTPVVYNGVTYFVPSFGDGGYAQGAGNMSLYWIALATGSLTQTGGVFTLLSPVNFGPSFGLTAVNVTSTTANPATAGSIRLANTDSIDWRNFANTGNLALGVNGTNQLTYQGLAIPTAGGNGQFAHVSIDTTDTNAFLQIGSGIGDSQTTSVLIQESYLAHAGPAHAIQDFTAYSGASGLIAYSSLDVETLLQGTVAMDHFAAFQSVPNIQLTATSINNVVGLLSFGNQSSGTITNARGVWIQDYIQTGGTIGTYYGLYIENLTKGSVNWGVFVAANRSFFGGQVVMGSTIDMGGNKITGLANGTTATDAVAFGQLTGGTVTSVSGTTNQINSTGGTTPVLSLSSTVILPGTLSVPSGTINVNGGTNALPGIIFNGITGTGIFTDGGGTGNVAISENGTLVLEGDQTTKEVRLHGTNTNNNAPAGFVGEYVVSAVNATNFPTTGQFGDLTSISLTAGDWDVAGVVFATANGAIVTSWRMGISTTTGNSATGLVLGDNSTFNPPPTSTYSSGATIPAWRRSLASTTTIYLKYTADYTGGSPQAAGRLSARRVR